MVTNMSKYYVYLHVRKDTNKVFYVGRGSGTRASSKASRNSLWRRIVNEHGFYYRIYEDNLTLEESIDIESDLILYPDTEWELVNIKPPSSIIRIDAVELAKLVQYDITSASGLSWCSSGKRAGSKTVKTGYYSVQINNVSYRVHRVIYALCRGNFDETLTINHIDGNTSNNLIENLELVTQQQNNNSKAIRTQNRPYNNNTSGYANIQFQLNKGAPTVRVKLQINGVLYQKRYSENKYGREEAIRLALEYRDHLIRTYT